MYLATERPQLEAQAQTCLMMMMTPNIFFLTGTNKTRGNMYMLTFRLSYFSKYFHYTWTAFFILSSQAFFTGMNNTRGNMNMLI